VSTDELKQSASSLSAHQAFQCLRDRGFFIISLSEGEHSAVKGLYGEMEAFFAHSTSEKEQMAPPRRSEKGRTQFSGYSQIYFDNRDNLREPELRDVFQIRPGEADPVPWPSDGSLEEEAMRVYGALWEAACGTVRLLARETGHDADRLLHACSPPESHPLEGSESSNLCLFRYRDEFGYVKKQVCMVHQDQGFVTIVPRSTCPGLEVFDAEHEQFVPIERFLAENECIAYVGVAMEHAMAGRVRSLVHRVVRSPGVVRYSMPFELKPQPEEVLPVLTSERALLGRLEFPEGHLGSLYEGTEEEGSEDWTFSRLEVRLQWQRTVRNVNRADAGVFARTEALEGAEDKVMARVEEREVMTGVVSAA